MTLSMQYQLVGRGWAICSLNVYDQSIELTSSYLCDGWTNVLEAIASIVKGADKALALPSERMAIFAGEPGEYRWIFRPVGSDRLHIQIRSFPQWGDNGR